MLMVFQMCAAESCTQSANSSHTNPSSDIYLTKTVFTCEPGLRLNDGHENASVECMANGYWRDHDFYTDCAGQLIVEAYFSVV